MNEKIINALIELGYPIKADKYTGQEKTYFVFNYADIRGTEFADDEPGIELYSIQVHFFTDYPFDYTKLIKSVKRKLHGAGFSWPSSQVLYENDTNKIHIVFTCEIGEENG